ncbi:MAG: M23 family metallopeptidase, partial [Spirochaetota bacterium]
IEAQSGRAQRERQPISARFRAALRAIGAFLRRVVRSGKQRFTIMFIPHSEKRVFNLQLNTFALLFVGVLATAVLGGFFYLATAFTGTERLADETGSRLREAEASLEQVRQEVGEFLQVYDDFEQTLANTLQRLDIDSAEDSGTPSAGGDLASMLNLEEVGEGDMREILDLERVVASLRASMGPLSEISEVLDLHKQLLSDIPNFWPVLNGLGYVTMEFGPNIHPIQGIWYMHKGIDIAYYPGTPIVSAANGIVTDAGFDNISGYGGFVEIDHNYGFKTKYGHMTAVNVNEGDQVVQGQRIGTMGNTGMSTGTHLDFQIWIGTENIDPAYFLKLSKPDFNRRTRNRS